MVVLTQVFMDKIDIKLTPRTWTSQVEEMTTLPDTRGPGRPRASSNGSHLGLCLLCLWRKWKNCQGDIKVIEFPRHRIDTKVCYISLPKLRRSSNGPLEHIVGVPQKHPFLYS